MITNLYTIYDSKAEAYNAPFTMQNDQMAIRAFKNMAEDPKSMVCANPEDYSLFHIGTYDDEHARIMVLDKQPCLGKAIELKENQHPLTAAGAEAYNQQLKTG